MWDQLSCVEVTDFGNRYLPGSLAEAVLCWVWGIKCNVFTTKIWPLESSTLLGPSRNDAMPEG